MARCRVRNETVVGKPGGRSRDSTHVLKFLLGRDLQFSNANLQLFSLVVRRDATKIAVNSFASLINATNLDWDSNSACTMNSNQNTVSSASSSTIPSLERKSERDRARQAAR